jgi:integral membrane protein
MLRPGGPDRLVPNLPAPGLQELPVSPRPLYRTLSVAEAVTWTLLIIGMLLKYVVAPGEFGDAAVRVSGFVHGLVFLGYGMTAVLVGINQHWRPRLMLVAVATAVVPYATIPFDHWLERRNLLAGGWRRDATDDPRDTTVLSRLLRIGLARPLLFASALAVGLVAVFTTLLMLGPPGGA